jgi:hypothetical protein
MADSNLFQASSLEILFVSLTQLLLRPPPRRSGGNAVYREVKVTPAVLDTLIEFTLQFIYHANRYSNKHILKQMAGQARHDGNHPQSSWRTVLRHLISTNAPYEIGKIKHIQHCYFVRRGGAKRIEK